MGENFSLSQGTGCIQIAGHGLVCINQYHRNDSSYTKDTIIRSLLISAISVIEKWKCLKCKSKDVFRNKIPYKKPEVLVVQLPLYEEMFKLHGDVRAAYARKEFNDDIQINPCKVKPFNGYFSIRVFCDAEIFPRRIFFHCTDFR